MAISRPSNYVWIDGELVPWDAATVHVTALGWSTMGAVFEGVSAYWNPEQEQLYGLQLSEHYARLLNSMKLMRLQAKFTVGDLVQASIDLVRANDHHEDVRVRPLAYQADATWFGTLLESATSIVISTAPFTSGLGKRRKLRACVSSWDRISDNQLSPRVKCISNYQNSRMALIEATMRSYDQPIILNQQGKVTEGPASCLFIVRNGVAITPSLTSGILESITRQSILQFCHDVLGIPTQEREIDRTELYIADEVFFCGTGAEVVSVVSVDDYTVGSGDIGPITSTIEAYYHDIVRGREDRYDHWRVPIYSRVGELR
ncbi:MAG TPA: branched-chain amino acid transaminase [Chloroflexota bacterium]|nr:branched-chain amino acid transaminase [Chloroflexota bacterium]